MEIPAFRGLPVTRQQLVEMVKTADRPMRTPERQFLTMIQTIPLLPLEVTGAAVVTAATPQG